LVTSEEAAAVLAGTTAALAPDVEVAGFEGEAAVLVVGVVAAGAVEAEVGEAAAEPAGALVEDPF
jgi:hypothetical protein